MPAADLLLQPIHDYFSGSTEHLFSLHDILDSKMDPVASMMQISGQELRNHVDFASGVRLLECEDQLYDPKAEGKTEVPDAFYRLGAVWPEGWEFDMCAGPENARARAAQLMHTFWQIELFTKARAIEIRPFFKRKSSKYLTF